jgi:Leucine-rich repeat (LRR) protein/energy-coupling factor transporter ATP-binding protein EcfA2
MRLLGPALTRAVLTRLLRDEIRGGDIAGTLTGSLNIPGLVEQLGGDYAQARQAQRFFEEIGDKAAAGVARIFEQEGETIAAAAQDEVARAVAATLQETALSLLLDQNLDERKWRRALRTVPPPADLHPEHHDLYRRVLDECGRTVFGIAEKVPNFTRDTLGTLLARTDHLQREIDQVLLNLDRVYVVSYGANQAEAARTFERDYRHQLAHRLDRLKLFGMPPSVQDYEQPLSVAYVTLKMRQRSLTGDENDRDELGPSLRLRRERTDETVLSPMALAQGRRWLVVGRAGSGKTTLLKWVAIQAARQNFQAENEALSTWQTHIPFFVRLRDFAQKDLPAWADLPIQNSGVPELQGSVPLEWTLSQLKQGRGLILMDGLDEVNPDKREAALKWVEDLLALAPESVVVVSTRPDTLGQATLSPRLQRANFRMLVVQDMDEATIERFIDHWHTALGHERSLLPDREKSALLRLTDGLKRVVARQPAVRQLMCNPLLCAMVCALNQNRNGHLTSGSRQLDRIELYRDCLTVLLERRDTDRGVDVGNYIINLTQREKEQRLGTLAYWLMDNGLSSTSKIEAAAQLGHGGEALLRWLVERSGLLHWVGVEEVEFVHRTFQEFLAAKDIVYRNNIRVVCHKALNSNWHETIRLTAGLCHDLEKQQLLLNQLQAQAEAISGRNEEQIVHQLALESYSLMVGEESIRDLAVAHARALMTEKYELYLEGVMINDAGLAILDGLPDLQILTLRNTQLTDVGLTYLSKLNDLRNLDLSYTAVTDVGMIPVAELKNLELLILISTAVTDTGLIRLAPLENLRELVLYDTVVTNTGMVHISKLGNLEALLLSSTAITDAGLAYIVKLVNLQWLLLSNTVVSDMGLEYIGALGNLRQLNLQDTAVTDTGLFHLANLAMLQWLNLSNTAVADAGLVHLVKLDNLQELNLSNTVITDRGLTHLTGLKQLQLLVLSNTAVTNTGLVHLIGLDRLKALDVSNTAVTDLAPLQAQIERGLEVIF